jgi:LPS-assembly protein
VVLPKISAPHSSTTETETVFTGGARLTYDNLLLLADEIRYSPKTQVAHAIGNVSMTRGTQRMLADEMTYNLTDKTYTVKNVRAGTPPYYISGSAVEGGPTSVIIHDATLTFSDPSILTPTLKADSLNYIPGDSVQTKNAQVGVGPFRPIPVPSYKQSVQDPIFSHMTAKAGFGSKMGAYVELGLLAPVTPSLKLGGDLGIYSSRGVLIGPGMEYKSTTGDQTVRGKLTTGYINDQGDRDNDVLRNPIPADRDFVSWEHYQTIGEHLSLLGNVNYWSDSYVVRDFRPEEYKNVQNPDNFFEGTYTQDSYVLSAFTRFQPNNYEAVQQRLPEVRFDGLPIEMGSGIYHRFNASFAVLRDAEPTNAIVAGPTLTSDRLDAYYSLTRPFTPREWLSVKPVVGARFTYYDQAQAGRDNYSRMLGEIGFDAELHGNATYDYKNERWGIDGLRHEVTPYVSYRYIPEASKGQRYIPPIDRDTFATYLQPLGLGDRRDIDTLKNTTTLRLGLDNVLQTRDKNYGSRNLVDLNMATDWSLDPQGAARFSAIQTQLLVTPANWVQFDLYQNVTPDDMRLRELNMGVTFRDAKVWSLRLGSDYLEKTTYQSYATALPLPINGLQQYTAELHYFLNEVYEAITMVAYDSQRGQFTRQDYGLRQNIRNVWFISYLLAFSEGDTRESSVGFSVRIELAKF